MATKLWKEIQKIKGGSELLDALNEVLAYVSSEADIDEAVCNGMDAEDHVDYHRAIADMLLGGETTLSGIRVKSLKDIKRVAKELNAEREEN